MGRVIGYVDGFRADVLHGWLANLVQQDALAPFIVRDEKGREFAFSTNFYRADVCQALHINGLFGFALRRSWLDPRSRSITVMTPQGLVVQGGENITLPDLPSASLPESVDILLHLAKTAGTSVRHALVEHFSEGETLLVYPGTDFGVREHLLPTIPLYQRRCLRLVIGHCNFGIHDLMAVPARYSVFLRSPAARLRSNIAHHQVARTMFVVGGQRVSLSTAINEGLSEEFDNLMVRVLAGLSRDIASPGTVAAEHVDRALGNLRSDFKFVGLHETMVVSFTGLCDAMGLPQLPLPMDNVTPIDWPQIEGQLEAIDWRLVLHRNRHDIALYKAIIDNGLVGRIG
jgi:hypothetical protein